MHSFQTHKKDILNRRQWTAIIKAKAPRRGLPDTWQKISATTIRSWRILPMQVSYYKAKHMGTLCVIGNASLEEREKRNALVSSSGRCVPIAKGWSDVSGELTSEQFNDVYPSTSWAYVDYYLRPKPAYYNIRRAFAPISIGIQRNPASRFIDEDHFNDTKIPEFAFFAHNTTDQRVDAELVVRAYDMHTRAWIELPNADANRRVTLQKGQNTELGTVTKQAEWTEESLIVLEAKLVSGDGKTLARIMDWPEPFRYLHWPRDTRLDVKAEKHDRWEYVVTIVANAPIKGCWLEAKWDETEEEEEPEPLWEDNMFDLMPDSPITVGVKGLRGRTVVARFLGDWEL